MKNVSLRYDTMRAIWSSVATINAGVLQLNDLDLVQKVIGHLDRNISWNGEDRQLAIDYVGSKVMLIRDLAAS